MAAYRNPATEWTPADASDEKGSARISIRAKPRIKQAIQKAAALSGLDETAFVLNAAYNRAIETIERHERTLLSKADFDTLLKVLENPPPPTEKLKAAMRRHSETIDSK